MMPELINQVKQLYIYQGLSGVRVGKILNLPVRQVYRIMDKFGIVRRSSSESNSIRFSKEAPTFNLKKKLSSKDKILLASGLMLYWAEGGKDKRAQLLDLANSDPLMIKIFLKFLRNLCGVKEGKLRIYLYCYANQNVSELKKFWSKLTKIPLEQFTKPYVRQDFKENQIGRMPYGLIHVRYCDKKLYGKTREWHNKLIRQLDS